MKYGKWMIMAPIFLGVSTLLFGCGARNVDSLTSTLQGQVTSGATSTSSSSSTSTTLSASSGTTANFLPAYSYSFSITGTGTQSTPPVNTDSILRVRVNSGPAGQVSGTNYNGTYTCVSYMVTAIGESITTQPLAVDGSGCNPMDFTGQQNTSYTATSQIVDFSNRLTPGHGPITITVSNVRYDYYCEMFWQYYNYYGMFSPMGTNSTLYCPLHTVYSTHVVTGSLDIEVNGTTL